ncbi:MAG TPA: hypothetical protein VHA57_10670 [Actinomycetota bacterium]|nr:hypothetical protein [Actinomycetota bacterium]
MPDLIRLAKGLVLTVVALVVLAVVALSLGSRYLVQDGVVNAVRAKDPSAQNVTASVSLPLLYTFLTQRTIGQVTVAADDVDLGSVTAAHVSAVATGVHLRVPISLTDVATPSVKVTGIDHIDITVSLTDAQASAAMPAGYTLSFGQGTLTLRTPFGSVTGRARATSPGHIGFTVVGSPYAGFTFPEISFSAAPLPGCLDRVTLTPGELTVNCAEDNPPTTFLPTVTGG